MKTKIEQIEQQLAAVAEDEQTDPFERHTLLVGVSLFLEELLMDLEQSYAIDSADGYEDEGDDFDDLDDDLDDDFDDEDDWDDFDYDFDTDW